MECFITSIHIVIYHGTCKGYYQHQSIRYIQCSNAKQYRMLSTHCHHGVFFVLFHNSPILVFKVLIFVYILQKYINYTKPPKIIAKKILFSCYFPHFQAKALIFHRFSLLFLCILTLFTWRCEVFYLLLPAD